MSKHLNWLAATLAILSHAYVSRAEFLPVDGGPTQAAVPVRGTAVNASGVAVGDHDVVEDGRFAGAVRWSGSSNLATELGALVPALNPENFDGYRYGIYVRGINSFGTAVGSTVDYYDSYVEDTGESQSVAISR